MSGVVKVDFGGRGAQGQRCYHAWEGSRGGVERRTVRQMHNGIRDQTWTRAGAARTSLIAWMHSRATNAGVYSLTGK